MLWQSTDSWLVIWCQSLFPASSCYMILKGEWRTGNPFLKPCIQTIAASMQMEGASVQNTQSKAASASEPDSQSLLSLTFMEKATAPGDVPWALSQGRRRRELLWQPLKPSPWCRGQLPLPPTLSTSSPCVTVWFRPWGMVLSHVSDGNSSPELSE